MAKKEISLLTTPPFDLTIQGRIVNWLITWGRAILVLVELVVISAFFSRFWLDRKNSDLSDDVRQKRAILESTVKFEEEFRFLQKRLSKVRTLWNQKSDLLLPITLSARSIPEGVVLESISWGERKDVASADLKIVVFSEQGLSAFVEQLLKDERVDSVTLGAVKKEKIAAGIEISLLVKFRENEQK